MLTEFQCSTIFRWRTGRNENRACGSVYPKAVFRTAHRGESPLPYSTSRRSHPQRRCFELPPCGPEAPIVCSVQIGQILPDHLSCPQPVRDAGPRIRCENLSGDFEAPVIEHFFEDHSDLRFVIFAKRFSCAARIDAGDDCIAARAGIAIERLSRSGAGVRA